jgi:hypothetical protein
MRLRSKARGHAAAATSVKFLPSTNTFASVGFDKRMLVYDLNVKKLVLVFHLFV